jgi:hypothetical protein
MKANVNPKALPKAIEVLQQADELLKIFAGTDWETLTSQQKVAAGLLGKWVCDRSIRAFCEANEHSIPANADLLSLLNSSGLKSAVPVEYVAALECVEKYVHSPEPSEPGWEMEYEIAYSIAHGLRSIVLQTLILLSHQRK